MKVIILNDFAFVNGGAGQVAIDTAVMLAKRGIDTCLFTAVGSVEQRLLQVENLRVVCLGQYDILHDTNRLRSVVQGIWNRKAEKALSKLLINYDAKDTIIHVHTCQKALSSSCVWRAKRMGFKVIYHMHDYGIACPNLGFYNYRSRAICKQRAMSGGCLLSNCDVRHYTHKIWRYVRQLVQNYIAQIPQGLDGYIAVSEFSYKILKPYLAGDAFVRIVPNPCPIHVKERVLVEKNTAFIFVGRLSPEKNPMLFAKCAKHMRVPAVFIGDGTEAAAIKSANPEAILYGWIPREDLHAVLQNARCLVFPSAWYETQGLVVAEMAAYGIPAIVSNTSAASDYIKDGNNGLLFESDNERALESCMNRMMNDSYVAQMGACAFESFQTMVPTNEEYMENILEVYQEVLRV
ncbi:glycosyltransferase, group 1 family protein [Selenomonas sp. FOBRC9]|uniref:glycosyltransferase family 4 protein n=1 Tax=Selenomonas sp. FOBRC9 TaxID=936573 RepID=UPI00027A5730|nr:glycosyltransferase [Selenomonas sp. FOBRC9]EJP32570.1 glycosyltransferase, group 1 family protein [Selenomonas sp. FOBRC9]